MKILSITLAACAFLTVSAAQTPSFAETTGNQQIAESKKMKTMKRIVVRNRGEVRQAFSRATLPGTAAIDITCSPASSAHCSGDFTTACDNADGGLSQGPDGITCSLPDAN